MKNSFFSSKIWKSYAEDIITWGITFVIFTISIFTGLAGLMQFSMLLILPGFLQYVQIKEKKSIISLSIVQYVLMIIILIAPVSLLIFLFPSTFFESHPFSLLLYLLVPVLLTLLIIKIVRHRHFPVAQEPNPVNTPEKPEKDSSENLTSEIPS
jgi:hypothetical protein